MNRAMIDFEEERHRHGQIFGREDVIERLCAWLVGEHALPRGWVLLLGGPGVGKSAIITQVLERLERSGPTPHHFIRRGNEGWDRPEVIVQSLCAQIEALLPEHASAELPSEARLGDLLKRVSKSALAPRDRRLVLVIDGLDEAASDGPDATPNPLPLFLPRVPPPGVVILCASRPKYPHLDWLNQRDGVRRVNLDSSDWSTSNEAACRAYWAYHAPRFVPPLDDSFVDEAVRRAEGNLLHATRLREWLEDQPPERRAAMNIPEGISGFLNQIWRELPQLDGARRALVIAGLGIACAAREALPVYFFDDLLEGPMTSTGEAFLGATRPFLREELNHDGRAAYQLYHEHFREFIAEKLGQRRIREHHRQLASVLAGWPPGERDPERRLYALRHAVAHRIEAGEVEEARRLVTDVGYLAAKCRELGVPAIERDLEAVMRATAGDASFELAALTAAISAEAARLSAHPEAFATLLYNRLRCAGWPAERIERVLRFDGGLPPLRLLHGVQLRPTLLRTFAGHDKATVACAVTPGGGEVLTASADRTLRLWSLGTGECLAELRGHEDELTSCAITPDGAIALSTSVDGTARLWDLSTRGGTARLDNGGRWATACAVTADGGRFVVGSDDGTLTVWERDSRRRLATLAGHRDYVTACLVALGDRLVSASRDRSVRVWDLASGTCAHVLQPVEAEPPEGQEDRAWITALALLPGEQALVVAGDGTLSKWDLASGRCLQRFASGQGRVDACAVLRNGTHILCGVADGTIAVWDLAAEKCVVRLCAHDGPVAMCTVTPDGRQLLSASTAPTDRPIRLWEIGALEGPAPQDGHTAPIAACGLTPDGSTAVSASEDGALKVWDVGSGACLATREGHGDLVTACAISADGRRVVSGARDGSVRVWSLDTGVVAAAERHWAPVSGCVFTPDGRMITASRNGEIWIRSPAALDRFVQLGVHDEGSVDGLVVTLNGAHALSISHQGIAKVWDIASLRCKRTIPTAPLLSGALTPDGKLVVLAFSNGQVEVREVHGRQVVRVLRGPGPRVLGCTVSADGARVITAAEDGMLAVWSMESGHRLGTLPGTSRFRCVSAARGRICAGDQEGNLWMLDDTPARASRREAPPTQADLAQLGDALANLYDSLDDARMVAKIVGLDIRRIELTGSPSRFWFAIITAARGQGFLERLVRHARKHSDDDALVAAARALGLE